MPRSFCSRHRPDVHPIWSKRARLGQAARRRISRAELVRQAVQAFRCNAPIISQSPCNFHIAAQLRLADNLMARYPDRYGVEHCLVLVEFDLSQNIEIAAQGKMMHRHRNVTPTTSEQRAAAQKHRTPKRKPGLVVPSN